MQRRALLALPDPAYVGFVALAIEEHGIVPKGAPQKAALASWIYYAMSGGQAFGAQLDFAPIPKVVLKAGIKSVGELQK